MKKRFLLAFITLTLTTTIVNAQYLKSTQLSEKSKLRKKAKQENIIKISPLGFATGSFPVYYEKRINNFFTVQTGAGLTGKNYLRDAIQKTAIVNDINYPWGKDTDYGDAAEALFSFDYRRPSMGYMFSIQPRLYFDSEAPDGAYAALSYDYYRHNFSIPGLVVENSQAVHNGAAKSEHENLNDLMVHFGYHAFFKHLTLDASGGLGLRSAKGNKYAALFDNASGQITNEGFASYSQTVFNFGIGLKIGYHF